METKPYRLENQLRTEEERELFLQAMIDEGASEEELSRARDLVEQSRLLHP